MKIMTPRTKRLEAIGEPYRKLSAVRVLLAITLLAALGYSGYLGFPKWQATQTVASHKPWFAAYVDVTATPRYAFEQVDNTSNKQVVLSFVVAQDQNTCTPSWGGAYSLDAASSSLDLDRRIARLRQQGGSVAISFGGQLNTELAVACSDTKSLKDAYRTVIDTYNVDTIDIDLERNNLTSNGATIRRASALAELQQEYRSKGRNLAIWVTLPVTPQGLNDDATNAVTALLARNVDLAGINVMTMDYGNSLSPGQSMFDASKNALIETHRQLSILYDRAGIHQSHGSIWSKMGATPMLGQNDDKGQIFSLKDADEFNKYAAHNKLGRMSMWSVNRDVACGQNYVDVTLVSSSCSGVIQTKLAYSTQLSENFLASMHANAGIRTKAETKAAVVADDPKTSPYAIWSKAGAYLQGTKVVWHGNVYEAKWWTQGELPDDPVLQSWQTAWRLIGPVLPNEKPITQATLPDGTYPDWTGETAYNEGDRVLFNGTPFQAKWWNKSQSPAAYSSNADASAWVPLTQEQVNEVLSGL
jgi:chitinase